MRLRAEATFVLERPSGTLVGVYQEDCRTIPFTGSCPVVLKNISSDVYSQGGNAILFDILAAVA